MQPGGQIERANCCGAFHNRTAVQNGRRWTPKDGLRYTNDEPYGEKSFPLARNQKRMATSLYVDKRGGISGGGLVGLDNKGRKLSVGRIPFAIQHK
jgi:hypothetical protein